MSALKNHFDAILSGNSPQVSYAMKTGEEAIRLIEQVKKSLEKIRARKLKKQSPCGQIGKVI